MLVGFDVPLIKNFYANSFINAFVLNALAVAIVAASSVELRQLLNNEKGNTYAFFNSLLKGKALTELQKSIIVFLGSFTIALATYVLLYLIFGFGGGMLTSLQSKEHSFKGNDIIHRLTRKH